MLFYFPEIAVGPKCAVNDPSFARRTQQADISQAGSYSSEGPLLCWQENAQSLEAGKGDVSWRGQTGKVREVTPGRLVGRTDAGLRIG